MNKINQNSVSDLKINLKSIPGEHIKRLLNDSGLIPSENSYKHVLRIAEMTLYISQLLDLKKNTGLGFLECTAPLRSYMHFLKTLLEENVNLEKISSEKLLDLIFTSNIISSYSNEQDIFNMDKNIMRLCPLLFSEDHIFASDTWEILTSIYILNYTVLHLSSESELPEYN